MPLAVNGLFARLVVVGRAIDSAGIPRVVGQHSSSNSGALALDSDAPVPTHVPHAERRRDSAGRGSVRLDCERIVAVPLKSRRVAWRRQTHQ